MLKDVIVGEWDISFPVSLMIRRAVATPLTETSVVVENWLLADKQLLSFETYVIIL